MKPRTILLAAIFLALAALTLTRPFAAAVPPASGFEYATIRWDGRDNTHIIRPGGKVEHIGPELRKLTRPERTDERAFYLNAAMNGLNKEGYEFAGMTPDEIVMKRPVTP